MTTSQAVVSTVLCGALLIGLSAAGRAQDSPTPAEIAETRKNAEQGDAEAQTRLGYLYDTGRGVPQDYSQAFLWYRRAADQGDATAQFNLGMLYNNGLGVPKDPDQAIAWWRKAADQGDAGAQFNLGFLYAEGRGVPQNDFLAMSWFLIRRGRRLSGM